MMSTDARSKVSLAGLAEEETEAAAHGVSSQKNASQKKPTKRPLVLEDFGLSNEAQWLLTVPSRFEDYKTFTNDFGALCQGTMAMVRGRIIYKSLKTDEGQETKDPRVGSRLFVVIANPYNQTLAVSAFGRPGFAWEHYTKGSDVIVYGRPVLKEWEGRPAMELSQAQVVKPALLGSIRAVYPKIRRTKGERFGEVVQTHKALLETAAQLLELETGWSNRTIGPLLSEATQFPNARVLLQELHWPTSVERANKAQIAARLLSAWTLVHKTQQRLAAVQANPRSIVNIDMDLVDELKRRIPFSLTQDQHNAIDGICRSLKSPLPMTGLLSGDVGSGKTLSFLVPMVATHRAGKKAMLMTPNLLLIKQVAMDLQAYFPEIPVHVVTGKKPPKGDKSPKPDPDKCIVIGTSALLGALEKDKLGRKPDLLVVDEQHKFSVEQREKLLDAHTNSLEATATPIPRTAALATHGAKDLFLLRQIPVEKHITSRVCTRGNHDEARDARNAILHAVITRGEQAAVIYPLVESDDPQKALRTVTEAAANWSRKIPMEQIAVLHGRMKAGKSGEEDEKNLVLDAFRRGEKRLLLASTVIEVGVTLPELKTMLVLGAEVFGVVTLHQLRGRLARHGGDGEFIMMTESSEPETMERLELLVQHQDGYMLAEKDAEARGYGDVLGIDGDSQSGATRTVFLGVSIGPQHISFAANLQDKLQRMQQAHLAAEAANAMAHPGETLRLV